MDLEVHTQRKVDSFMQQKTSFPGSHKDRNKPTRVVVTDQQRPKGQTPPSLQIQGILMRSSVLQTQITSHAKMETPSSPKKDRKIFLIFYFYTMLLQPKQWRQTERCFHHHIVVVTRQLITKSVRSKTYRQSKKIYLMQNMFINRHT